MQKLFIFFIFSLFFTGAVFTIQPQFAHATIAERVPISNPLAPSDKATNSRDIQSILSDRFSNLISLMFALLGTLSIFPIVIGGIQLIISRGNSSMVEKGKNTLLWGIVGLTAGILGVVIFSFLLDLFIQSP